MSSVLQHERALLGAYAREVGRTPEVNEAYHRLNNLSNKPYKQRAYIP